MFDQLILGHYTSFKLVLVRKRIRHSQDKALPQSPRCFVHSLIPGRVLEIQICEKDRIDSIEGRGIAKCIVGEKPRRSSQMVIVFLNIV